MVLYVYMRNACVLCSLYFENMNGIKVICPLIHCKSPWFQEMALYLFKWISLHSKRSNLSKLLVLKAVYVTSTAQKPSNMEQQANDRPARKWDFPLTYQTSQSSQETETAVTQRRRTGEALNTINMRKVLPISLQHRHKEEASKLI